MPGWLWVVIVVAALIIIGAVVATALRARRSRELQGRFGPEYDRVAADAPSKRQAEAELKARAERHDEFDLRPLDPRDRDAYRSRWQDVQAKFVDDPEFQQGSRERVVKLQSYDPDTIAAYSWVCSFSTLVVPTGVVSPYVGRCSSGCAARP